MQDGEERFCTCPRSCSSWLCRNYEYLYANRKSNDLQQRLLRRYYFRLRHYVYFRYYEQQNRRQWNHSRRQPRRQPRQLLTSKHSRIRKMLQDRLRQRRQDKHIPRRPTKPQNQCSSKRPIQRQRNKRRLCQQIRTSLSTQSKRSQRTMPSPRQQTSKRNSSQ